MSNPAESTRTLVIERVFPHPPEKLWRALTENPLIAQWLMKSDFEPVIGRKFQFRADPMPNWNGIVDCEVLIVDPLQRLSYNWGVGDAAGVGFFDYFHAERCGMGCVEHGAGGERVARCYSQVEECGG